MYQRPFFNCLLFLASFLIVASILFGISACTPQEKIPEPTTQQPAKEELPLLSHVILPVTVDFNAVPLSEVAQFVTTQTGKGFTFSGLESHPITWIENNMARDKIFDSFKVALTASNLLLNPANEQQTLFTIEKPEEQTQPVLLDYARSSRGVFLRLGSTIYPLDKFPYPVRYDSGHWYGLLPKSISDQKKTGSVNEKS